MRGKRYKVTWADAERLPAGLVLDRASVGRSMTEYTHVHSHTHTQADIHTHTYIYMVTPRKGLAVVSLKHDFHRNADVSCVFISIYIYIYGLDA